VRALRVLYASRWEGVRGESETFGGRGRSEKRAGIEVSFCGTGGVEAAVEGVSVAVWGVEADRPTGVGTLEMLEGVFTAEGRGLFFERGRDEGAERKSSGMSFHCSVVRGMGVVLEGARLSGMRGGAEMDLGGGGGRFGAAEACGGGGGGCVLSLLATGFFSQPESEDWSMFAGVRVVHGRVEK
jgi:hypothetical protein